MICRRKDNTHNLIVSTTRVVRPSSLLHHPPCYSLEIHQVVALFQDWHPLDSLLPFNLFWIFLLLFLLDGIHVHLAQMLALVEKLVERVRRVDGLILFCRIFAGVLEDDLGAAGVFW